MSASVVVQNLRIESKLMQVSGEVLAAIVGRRVERYRTLKGFSQEKLAECANLSRSTISRLENGKIDGLKQLHAIASALRIDMTNLVQLKELTTDDLLAILSANSGLSLRVSIGRQQGRVVDYAIIDETLVLFGSV
jgi:transcriptional regulator with XRE-family HTH domain